MGRRKRPASSELEARLGSTDALCRAVKRLHTYSPATSSCTTSKGAGDGSQPAAEPEVNSAIGAISRLAASALSLESQQQAAGEAARERRPLAVDNRLPAARPGPEKEAKGQAAAKAPAAAAAGGDARPVPGLRLDVAALRQRMAHVAVSGAGCEADVVPQPDTPVQREGGGSGGSSKGHRLGTRAEPGSAGGQAYALLYEEANNLLKNLHFARLQRSAGAGGGGRDA